MLEREIAQEALAQASPLIRAWRGDLLEADLREEARQVAALITDDEAARKVAEAMKTFGFPPERFRARLVDIGGHRFIARIDFPDTSGIAPFVDILHASTPPGEIADGAALRRLAGAFADFAPRFVQFYHPAHRPLRMPGISRDHHFLAGLAREMAARQPSAGLARVSLRRPAGLEFYPRYVDSYQQMYAERPHLKAKVRIESEESLSECDAAGFLYEIMVDGNWAGIVAARPELIAGVRSMFMTEIVLNAAARGQGLGPAVHQRLAANVAAIDDRSILTGIIAAANVPSLKTATRAGRAEIGGWYRFDLDQGAGG
jgi:L-amino acid N-acyltransferase YncA